MGEPTTPPSRRSPSGKPRASLLSRLSLSPSKRTQENTKVTTRRDAPPVSPKNPARMTASQSQADSLAARRAAAPGNPGLRRLSDRTVAGPAYEKMANGRASQPTYQHPSGPIDFSQKPLPTPRANDDGPAGPIEGARSADVVPGTSTRTGAPGTPARPAVSRAGATTASSARGDGGEWVAGGDGVSYPGFKSPIENLRTPSRDDDSSPRLSTGQVQAASPPKYRQPIYPALASPPRRREATLSPPRSATSNAMTLVSLPDIRTPPREGLKVNTRPEDLRVVTTNNHTPPIQRTGSGGSRTLSSSSPVSPLRQQTTMQIIASSSNAPRETNGYRYDKHGRPLMSARRSATSSSKTITRGDASTKTALPSPGSPPAPAPVPTPPLPNGVGVSEASAYAKAVASSMSRMSAPVSPPRAKSTEAVLSKSPRSRADRPLPRPPSNHSGTNVSPRRSTSQQTMLKSRSERSLNRKEPASSPGVRERETPRQASDSLDFNFPRSPTIPALIDPRQASPALAARSPVTVRDDRAVQVPDSMPKARPMSPRAVNGGPIKRPLGRLSLDFLLCHHSIQAALLSSISINAFLSLTGSSEVIRQQFTGESIGRWVLREWGVQCPVTNITRWPNLTVWEGFLESLLHDPATYSTYPARWHNLLRHLSLSHTLVVLYLRTFPSSCFPNHSLLPFEDEASSSSAFPFSPSSTSLTSLGQPRSRVASVVGSDNGSLAPSKAPRRERVIEIVMPEPLAAQPTEEIASPESIKPIRRRGSISSLATAASFSFGRKRSNSHAADIRPPSRLNGMVPVAEPTASMAPGKGAPPPVSYPSAKRYGFKHPGEAPSRSRNSSISLRPGSIFSMQTSPSVSSYAPRMSQPFDMRAPLAGAQMPLAAPPPIGVRPRSSFGSSESNRRSERDQNSPIPGRRTAFPGLHAPRCEPAFDRPMPFIPGRAPVLRVFVPLSEKVRRWPSAEGATAAVNELEKCGALKRMQLGDLIVNTAIRTPRTTEHVLVYVPFVKHLLVPLQYVHVPTGHLPAYVDAFALPPSYYYPFLPAPQVIHLNLGPYREQGLRSMRLASDRRDMTVSSGARISAKRYLYVAGVEIRPQHKTAPEWQGMISLEAEGTAEGKADLEMRFGDESGRPAPLAPWEIVKEKSMGGTVWLRLVRQQSTQ